MARVDRGKPSQRPRIVATPEPVVTGEHSATAAEPAAAAPMVPAVSTPAATAAPAEAQPSTSATVVEPAVRDAFLEKMATGQVPTLDDCERHIARVTTQWLLAVGYALRTIKDHELFREKGFTSFTAYVRAEHPWDPSYVSRVIADIPVVEALERHGADRDVNEGQATALRPVLEEHGEQALLEVWDSTQGKRSAAALVRVARAKGYLPPEGGGSAPPTPGRAMSRTFVRIKEFAELVSGGDGKPLIQVAKEDPDWAREVLLPALEHGLWTLRTEFDKGGEGAQ
ncbi:hypothetical protein Misp03_36100 [Microbispora sp. NBRC 16548]|nr:hypothetical protein Misp03_36100 [Microbispora sp. NBRC 16548]